MCMRCTSHSKLSPLTTACLRTAGQAWECQLFVTRFIETDFNLEDFLVGTMDAYREGKSITRPACVTPARLCWFAYVQGSVQCGECSKIESLMAFERYCRGRRTMRSGYMCRQHLCIQAGVWVS